MTEAKTTKESVTVSYRVDEELSSIKWKGSLLGVYSHEGTVGLGKGKFTLTDGEPEMIYVSADLTEIIPTDDNYSEENTAEMLVGHLQSEDFFKVEEFPEALIIKKPGEAAMLTVRGVEKPIKLEDITVVEDDNGVVVKGQFVFDRQEFNVSYKGASEAVLSDEVEVEFEIRGKKA